MLILGQNGKYMGNLEKANGISITEYIRCDNTDCQAEIVIRFDNKIGESDGVVLGKYKTVERAMEVLQEITSSYAITELFKMPQMQINEVITGNELAKRIVYEMPKE